MQRRNFIKNSSLIAISVSAFGNISWNGKNFIGNSPTTTDILGPFYRPGAPMRSNLVPDVSEGIPLSLHGTIFNESGDIPIYHALVEIWQCDENEHYDNSSDDYLFRGAVKTGKDGKYNFKTIIPVPYQASPNDDSSWRPAHIHMRVSVRGQQDLITQIYFKGHRYVDSDPWSSDPGSVNRILNIAKDNNGNQSVAFDVVMSKEFPLEDKVYDKITGLYRMDDKSRLEFVKKDDLLFLKRNGQYMAGLRYIGNNTFEGGTGDPKVRFELQENGLTKSIVTFNGHEIKGVKFLKYT